MPLPLTRLVDNPRAVAVVLGHLGASESTLERYAKYYTDRNCSVVASASPPSQFMLNKSLRSTTEDCLIETAKILHDTPDTVSVVVHSFSNGGAFLLENIHVIFNEEVANDDDNTATNTAADSTKRQDFELVKSRLARGYIWYDSCPCYLRMVWDTSGLTDSFPVQRWSSPYRTLYTMGSMCGLTLWEACTLSWQRPTVFWNRMKEMNKLCNKEIFMYTTADLASDASKVDELIRERQNQGSDVKIYRYEDSGHCKLDKDHPEEYGEALDEALESVC